jgi:preprotein translocase, SecE subunit, bacterial
MARNRQRAKDRKRKTQENGQPDEAEEVVRPSLSKGDGAGAPPDDVDLDDGFEPEPEPEPEPVAVVGTEASTPVRKQQGSKLINFLRACWAELQRVQWPDRRQVGQATAVVLGFVLIAGAFLGLADAAATELVDLIL